MKVAFCTLGCKVNQYETDLMEKKFIDNGYDIVDFNELADVYVINSCSVTNLATRKSRQMLAKARRKNINAKIVLAGCYSEETGSDKSINDLKDVDIIIGNEEKNDIVKYVENFEKKKCKPVVHLKDIAKVSKYSQIGSLIKGKNVRESIKIEDGCNNFCTYCIIPYTRGRIRSRNINDIYSEIKTMVNNGVKEVVIVGIEIASYGKDLNDGTSLIDVIEKIDSIDGLERIRLGSIEPRWLTDENISRLSKIKKLCNHFHISVQSMSTSVLKRMNRKYTAEFVLGRIDRIRKVFTNPGITCDIITGFINETDEEFQETIENVKKANFSDMHIFKFSKRKGTAAYNMKTTVTDEEKNERSKILEKLCIDMKKCYMEKFIGKKESVLIDEEKDGYFYGYTKQYVKVKCKGNDILWGKVQDLELVSIEENCLIGKGLQK